jgi:hypothetical protein
MRARHGAAAVAVIVLALTGCGAGSAVQSERTVTGTTPANGSSSSSATTTTTTTVTPKATTSVTPKAQHPKDATASASRNKGDVASGVKGATITEGNGPRASKTAPLPTQPSATLRETCPKVEKAISGLSGKSSPPTAPKLDAALAQLKLLSRAGDTETRNALSALLEALPGFRDENPTWVTNDARVVYLDSLTNLADRCEAAGSSALRWVG